MVESGLIVVERSIELGPAQSEGPQRLGDALGKAVPRDPSVRVRRAQPPTSSGDATRYGCKWLRGPATGLICYSLRG